MESKIKPATEKELQSLNELFKGYSMQRLDLTYIQSNTFVVGFAARPHDVIFHFWPPTSMHEDRVPEGRRRSYMLAPEFGEALGEAWVEVFENKNFKMERLREESTILNNFLGLGRDSWCLRAPGMGLSPDETKMFERWLTLARDKILPLLQRFEM